MTDINISQTDQCRCALTIDRMSTEFIHATVTSCTTELLHISGQDTITIMDIGCVYFRHMSTDMFTMVSLIIAIMTSGIVHMVDITWSADLLSEQCSQRISLQT